MTNEHSTNVAERTEYLLSCGIAAERAPEMAAESVAARLAANALAARLNAARTPRHLPPEDLKRQMKNSQPKPKATTFEVATTGGGRETRKGYVLGGFAAHKERFFWKFTHLATGVSLSTYPCHDNKASALAHLGKLHTEGPGELAARALARGTWGLI